MMGSEATFEVLNVMEYSSARGRMSVIVRAPNGSIRLFCKGSDSKVLAILDRGVPQSIQDSTQANLHLFATQVTGMSHAHLSCTSSSCSTMLTSHGLVQTYISCLVSLQGVWQYSHPQEK